MKFDEGPKIGGAIGGLLRIFNAIGRSIVAILVGKDISSRTKLDVLAPIGGSVFGACAGGVAGILIAVPTTGVAGTLGFIGGFLGGLGLSQFLISLVQASKG